MTGFLETIVNWLQPAESGFPNLFPVAIFLCILFFMEGLYHSFAGRRSQGEKRIQQRLKFIEGLERNSSAESLIKEGMLAPESRWKRLIAKVGRFFNLDELLLQADISWKASTVLGSSILAGLGAGAYGFLQSGPLGGLGGLFLVGYLLPNVFLHMKKKYRLKKFEKQLPEALGLMARSLKAGHSFPSSMQLVADEMPNPIGIEFFKTFKEFNYGLDMSSALANLQKRIDLQDLKFFVTAINIQRETGGNLVEILEKIASLIRDRFKLVNHIKAITSEGRFSGLILTCLPPGMAIILYFLNKKYMLLLITHPWGKMMVGVALTMQLLGYLMIHKIVNIKV